MIPTLRLLLLTIIGTLGIALSSDNKIIQWSTIIYVSVLAIIAGYDGWHIPSPRILEAERINDSKLSIGVANKITILLTNHSKHPIVFQLRDEYPYTFSASTTFIDGQVDAMDISTISYTVEPKQRGAYQFGDIMIRCRSQKGLFLRQGRYAAAAEVKVYPDLLSIQRYDIMTRKGLAQEAGARRSRFFGSGTEFERLRDYQLDDEFRHINWKATARRGKPIAATYETERSQFVISMVDTGRLMRPAISGLAKLDHVINTVLLLSYVTVLKGDYVGLMTFADSVDIYSEPKRGKAQFQRILEALYNVMLHPVETDYARSITYLEMHHKRRSLVVVFTDLTTLDAAQTLIAHTSRIARRHLVLCVTISDPHIHALATQRDYSSSALYTRAVAENIHNERQAILDTLNLHGILTIDVPADQLTTHVIQAYLRLKERGAL